MHPGQRLGAAIALAILTGALSGCVMSIRWMIDENGRQAACSAGGYGTGGAPAALAINQLCVDRYKQAGYVELEEYEKTEGPKVGVTPGTIIPKGVSVPTLRVGECWNYRVSGIAHGSYTRRVTRTEGLGVVTSYVVGEGTREIVLDRELNLLEVREGGSTTVTYEPSLLAFPWPLEVGRIARREVTVRGSGKETTRFIQAEVKAYGTVTIPAGSFDSFYILVTAPDKLAPDIFKGPRVAEIWYAPTVRYYVKYVAYRDQGRQISELTSVCAAPGDVIRLPDMLER